MLWIFLSHAASFVLYCVAIYFLVGSVVLKLVYAVNDDDDSSTEDVVVSMSNNLEAIGIAAAVVSLLLFIFSGWLSFRLRRGPMPKGFLTTRWVMLAMGVALFTLPFVIKAAGGSSDVIDIVVLVGVPYFLSVWVLLMIPYTCRCTPERKAVDAESASGLLPF